MRANATLEALTRMTYHETRLRDTLFRLTSSHLLVESRLVECEGFYIEAFRILRFDFIEVDEGLSTLKVEVGETIVNELLKAFFRESRLNEFLKFCSCADSNKALFDHFLILGCVEVDGDAM